MLQELANAAHLNGRHGRISTPLESGRFGVDLDTFSKRKAIKPENLVKEQDITDDYEVAQPANGVLTEHPHGRTASYLLDMMRINAGYTYGDYGVLSQMDLERFRNDPNGQVKIAHLTSMGWSNWVAENNDGLEVGGLDRDGIFNLVKEGNKETLQEIEEKQIPKEKLPQELFFAKEALEAKHAAGGWHVRVHGNFWVAGQAPDTGGCYLIPEDNTSMVYEVLGVRSALYPMVSRHGPRPLLYSATLIPWYGRLLYDGCVIPAGNSPLPKQASPALAERLQQSIQTAVEQGRVITRLRDMESLPDQATQSANGATQPEESRYLEELAALPAPIEGNDDFEPVMPWAWTFRRGGYTEEENPNHEGLIIASAGFIVGPFDCSALAPSSVDILRNTLRYATELNRQPKVLSIDERHCCDRVKYLLRDTEIRVEYYRPPSQEESDAACALPRAY